LISDTREQENIWHCNIGGRAQSGHNRACLELMSQLVFQTIDAKLKNWREFL
jgi:hypothetical protein